MLNTQLERKIQTLQRTIQGTFLLSLVPFKSTFVINYTQKYHIHPECSHFKFQFSLFNTILYSIYLLGNHYDQKKNPEVKSGGDIEWLILI